LVTALDERIDRRVRGRARHADHRLDARGGDHGHREELLGQSNDRVGSSLIEQVVRS
jgi:hypothetical protein